MIKFDLGISQPTEQGKELFPRFTKTNKFFAVREGTTLKMFTDGDYVYEFSGVKENTPEAIQFNDSRHIKHVIDCYYSGSNIIVTYEVPEFIPTLPDLTGYEKIGDAPCKAVQAVKHASAPESLKPVFNSVCLFVGKNLTGTAATDSTRLSFLECDFQGLPETVILPLSFVSLINSDVEIFKAKDKYIFKSGNLYCSQNVEGTFPDVERILPDYKSLEYEIRILEIEKLKSYFDLFNVGLSSIRFNDSGKTIIINNTNEVPLEYDISENIPSIKVRFAMLMDALKVTNVFRVKGINQPLIFKVNKQIEIIQPLQIKE